MLNVFPAPYPDESWFSVLSRMYMRSGITQSGKFRKELYKSPHVWHDRNMPSGKVQSVWAKLPEPTKKIFPLETLLKEHTLLPYKTRHMRFDYKEKILRNIETGMSYWHESQERTEIFRYCPECYLRDRQVYGEPYWHRTHQLPLISVCPEHGCRLTELEVVVYEVERELLPLSQVNWTEAESRPITQAEIELSQVTALTLTLPWEHQPNHEHNIFKETMLERGLYQRTKTRDFFNLVSIWNLLSEKVGETLTEKYFANRIEDKLLVMMNWNEMILEPYLLLAIALGLDIRDVFPLPKTGAGNCNKNHACKNTLAYTKKNTFMAGTSLN